MNNYIFLPIPLFIGLLLGGYIIPRMMVVSIRDNWAIDPKDFTPKSFKAVQIAGLSLFPVLLITLCLSIMAYTLFDELEYTKLYTLLIPRTLQLMTGSALLYISGLKFDMHGSSSLVRICAMIGAAVILPACGIWINDLHGLFGIGTLPAWVGMPFTVLITVFIIEMVRILDGMDTLASGMSISILVSFIVLSLLSYSPVPAVVASSCLAVVLPYWLMKTFSKSWTKSLMGNSGSYVLGYILAYLCVVLSNYSGDTLGHNSQLLVFSIMMLPALDVVRVVGSRLRDGRGFNTPDRNQLNFKMLRTGMPEWLTVPALMLMIPCFGVVTYFLLDAGLGMTWIFVIDIFMWLFAELVMNFFIRRKEHREHQSEWNKVYGEDAWNANVPIEQIQAKQKAFGTMGLPKHFVEGSELDFIPDGMSAFEKATKRIFDICVSGFCLIVFSPLFLLSYILIKLDDGGPAIFKQERIGRFGRPFDIYKFRSMRLDAEKMGPQLSHSGGDDDPRLTKIGRFIRAHHLDELPQLWNVFRGDMALIGYRPERKFYIDQIMEHDPRYAFLYQIRPGVTSYATLYNGYTDTMEKMLRRLELDLYYLGHRSWWLDIKTLFLTFTSIAFGKKF